LHIVAIGLNYRTAPVEVREKFVFAAEDLPVALSDLKNSKSVLECVIVSTCNRTEIYAVVDKLERCGYYIRKFMEERFGIPKESFKDFLYTLKDQEAISHLFRVVAGLDSMVLGETQILGQVKDAFLLAQREEATGTWFNQLFKQAVTVAKRAHNETSIGENSVSVSYAAVELGKRIFGSYRGKKVAIIGAGKMSELTVKHLRSGGVEELYVLGRTYDRAAELAAEFGGSPRSMDLLVETLADTDIVISSTSAPGFVLTKEVLQQAMAHRRTRPLFMLDIAVPRDIEPAAGDMDNVFLYDIDDLQSIVDSNLTERRKEAKKVESMIENEMDAFEGWKKMIGVAPVIQALQAKAAAIHEETMASLLQKLPELDEREVKVIRKLTKSIANQLLRDPILRIKELSASRGGDEALDYFTHIFALEQQLAAAELSEADSAPEQQGQPSQENAAADWLDKPGTLALQ